jgi:aspartate aminotransferase
VSELRAHFAARRAQVVKGLSSIDGVHVAPPSGGFFAFFTKDGVTDKAAFALKVVREAGVAFAPGSAFGPGGERALRLCFAASQPTIREALDRLTKVLSSLR